MHLTSFTWWLILILNIVGYFVISFGMISDGASKEKIKFFGGTIWVITFPWMFLKFGWEDALVLLLFSWVVVAPIVKIFIRKIDRKLYGVRNSVIEKMTVGMSEGEKRNFIRYSEIGDEEQIDSMLKEYGLRKTIPREEIIKVFKKARESSKKRINDNLN